jgi:hypothetical protein
MKRNPIDVEDLCGPALIPSTLGQDSQDMGTFHIL